MGGWAIRLVWVAVAAFAAGCSSPSGGRLALFPEGHLLSPDTKMIRKTTPAPVNIPRELDKVVSGPYIVEPGDVLLVQPASLDSPVRLPGDQPVLPDGTIQLGRFGRQQVAGRPVEVIESEINARISAEVKDAGPINVRLVARESKVFYVLGEVNAPGAFPLRGREAVLDAILAAGGLNSSASRRAIVLSRPTAPDSCRVVLPVRYNDIVQLGDTTTNYQIRAGDRIFVPSTSLHEDVLRLFEKKEECRPQVGCPPAALIEGPRPMAAVPALTPVVSAPIVTPAPVQCYGPACQLAGPCKPCATIQVPRPPAGPAPVPLPDVPLEALLPKLLRAPN